MNFRNQECQNAITQDFIASLQDNDIFSCPALHLLPFLQYKHFNQDFYNAFNNFLTNNELKCYITDYLFLEIHYKGMLSPEQALKEYYHDCNDLAQSAWKSFVKNYVDFKHNNTTETQQEAFNSVVSSLANNLMKPKIKKYKPHIFQKDDFVVLLKKASLKLLEN